ncbi:MAG: DsbA family protein [Planctomycetes bacterium]|nr:DsbA family protein [Planctomycetota bacterium]
MEVTVYEDPACSWCWAFQPAATALAFELGHALRVRHVMGGLRDRPAADADFVVGQWRKAETISEMPFDPGIWSKHVLRTTYGACRAVKAAAILSATAAPRLLRRLQEAFFIERVPIDSAEEILRLAAEVGLDPEDMLENLSNGRAEALFARDRVEAGQHGFGFPTLVLRSGQLDALTLLQGAVPYDEILQTLLALGVPSSARRRFKDTREDWVRLFKVHRRLALAEIRQVTGMEPRHLLARLEEIGLRPCGALYELAEPFCRCCSRDDAAKTEEPAASLSDEVSRAPGPDGSEEPPAAAHLAADSPFGGAAGVVQEPR